MGRLRVETVKRLEVETMVLEGGRNDDGVGEVNGRRGYDGGCSDCCQIAGLQKYPPGINTRTPAEQVEALLAGTQEFYHTSGELTGYMICIFS